MVLKTIAATYGRKLNLGDYNSAHAEVTLWADLEESDDPELAANALRQMARHHVMEEMARVQPSLRAKVENLFMGLPTEVQAQLSDEYEEMDAPYDNGGHPDNFGDS